MPNFRDQTEWRTRCDKMEPEQVPVMQQQAPVMQQQYQQQYTTMTQPVAMVQQPMQQQPMMTYQQPQQYYQQQYPGAGMNSAPYAPAEQASQKHLR